MKTSSLHRRYKTLLEKGKGSFKAGTTSSQESELFELICTASQMTSEFNQELENKKAAEKKHAKELSQFHSEVIVVLLRFNPALKYTFTSSFIVEGRAMAARCYGASGRQNGRGSFLERSSEFTRRASRKRFVH